LTLVPIRDHPMKAEPIPKTKEESRIERERERSNIRGWKFEYGERAF